MKNCRFEGCLKPSHAYGLCNAHCRQFVSAGKPENLAGLKPVRDRAKPGFIKNCRIDGCDRVSDSLGLCAGHRMRLRNGLEVNVLLKATPAQRLAFLHSLKGHQGAECVVWPYAKGRGSIKIGARRRTAANVMCEIAHGAPLDGQEVAHSCNQGDFGCINPSHLRWATHTENMGDKFVHGTQPMGEIHYKSFIDAQTALAIFQDKRKPKEVADAFGVSSSLVNAIRFGMSWSHVTGYRRRKRKLDLINGTKEKSPAL